MKKVMLVLCTVSLALSLVSVQAETVPDTMAFRPPDSLTFRMTSLSVRQRTTDGVKGPVDSTFITTAWALRKSPTGYSIERTPLSTQYKRDTAKVENVVTRISSGIKVTIELTPQGMAKSARGYEKLAARLDSLPDQNLARTLRQQFTPQGMAEGDVSEWNGRMSHLVNRPVRIGILQFDTSSLAIGPANSLRLYIVTKMMDTVRIDGKLCARIRTAIDADAVSLGKALQISTAEVGALYGLPESALAPRASSDTDYHSTSDMTVETGTLLIRSETLSREIKAIVPDKSGKTAVSSMAESITKKYEYGK